MEETMRLLGNIDSFTSSPEAAKPAQASVEVVDDFEVFVELEGLVDFVAERQRLAKEQAKLTDDLARLEKKLANEGFLAKAAPGIIEKTKSDKADLMDALGRIAVQMEALPQE